MATADLNQDRLSYVDATGKTQFQIYSLVLNAISITDGLFLFKINDVLVPAGDTYERVCNIGDLSDFLQDRAAAVTAGDSYYRSSALTVDYDDIETAIAAATVIKERVSALIELYTQYLADFFGNDTTPVPTGDTTLFDALVATAEAQHVVYTAAQATAAAAMVTKNAADVAHATLDLINNKVIPIEADVTALEAVAVTSNAVATSIHTAALATGLDADPTYVSVWSTLNGFSSGTGTTSVNQIQIDLTARLADITALGVSTSTLLSNAAFEVTTTSNALVVADADEAAQLALRTQYAADVLAIDPTYQFSWMP